MKKVFGRKKSTSKLNNGTGGKGSHDPSSSSSSSSPFPAGPSGLAAPRVASSGGGGGKRSTDSSLTIASSVHPTRIHVDDFGRPVDGRPAFGKDSLLMTSPNGPLTAGPGSSMHSAFEDDNVAVDGADLQLLFGYAPIETLLELSVERVLELVVRCSEQIRTRGLDTPLILSSMSLDLSMEGTCSLIRTYLADPHAWTNDLQIASPLCVGAQMKWALARLVNDRGARGFVSWELYNEFKQSEKASGFPARHCATHLISRLATAGAQLLTELLSLFSSISAHSKVNGMPPRKLASLFSPYIFGLADDETFDVTYEQWQRATDATEHILLSFIRDQQATEGPLPTHLEKHVIGYPQALNLQYGSSRTSPKVPQGARIEEVVRIRRLTRFHSRNLIASAGTWSVPSSLDWALFFPKGHRPKTVAAASSTNPPVSQYTSYYRHLLNIRGNNLFDDEDDDGELQRYKSTVEKDWSKFGELGFKDVEPSKLEFDLTESERLAPIRKRDTMDWGTFASSGFGGRESFKPNDLIFHQSLNTRVNTWPASQQALDTKLRAAEKMLPSFPYDTMPREEARVFVDALFIEAWADVLVSGGWARDELKESSFALIQWKCRSRDGEIPRGRPTASGDDRTEDRWVLVEEFVPKEYRDELTEGKKKSSKRISFMRSVRKKSSKPSPLRITHPHHAGTGAVSSTMVLVSPPISSSYARNPAQLRTIDESVFNPEGTTPTKVVSLSRTDVDQATIAQSNYAPSFISTTGAGHGHSGGIPSVHEEPRHSVDEHPPRDSTSVYDQSEYGQTPRPHSPTNSLPPPVPAVPADAGHLQGLGVGVGSQHSAQQQQQQSAPAWIRDRNNSTSVASSGGGGGIGGVGHQVDRRAPVGNIKQPSTGPKNFLARMTSRNRKRADETPVPVAAVVNAGRTMPLTAAALAQYSPPRPPAPAAFPDGSPGRSGAAPPIMVQSPSTPMMRSESGGVPPPLPPKSVEPDLAPSRSPKSSHSADDHHHHHYHHHHGVRDSVMTTTTMGTDPYGGIESEAEVGQVMYRGAETDLTGEPSPRRVLLADVVGQGQSAFQQQQMNLPPSGRPVRHDSLPPSPKPDAEVPMDVGVGRDSRFLSGPPKGKQVGEIVGRIEDGKVGQHDSVRLTQYGFQ